MGCTDATQDDDALSPDLEKFIDRGGKLDEEMIVVDGEEKQD